VCGVGSAQGRPGGCILRAFGAPVMVLSGSMCREGVVGEIRGQGFKASRVPGGKGYEPCIQKIFPWILVPYDAINLNAPCALDGFLKALQGFSRGVDFGSGQGRSLSATAGVAWATSRIAGRRERRDGPKDAPRDDPRYSESLLSSSVNGRSSSLCPSNRIGAGRR